MQDGREPNRPRKEGEPPSNRRKQGRKRGGMSVQQLISLGAFAIAAVLLVACVVMLLQSGFKTAPKVSGGSSGSSAGSVSTGLVAPPAGSEAQPPAASSIPAGVDAALWNLRVISPASPVEADFPEPELEKIDTGYSGVYYFDSRAVAQLRDMLNACNAVAGNELLMYYGYVSYETQTNNFNTWYMGYVNQGIGEGEAAEMAAQHVQKPGEADAHTGLGASFYTQSVEAQSEEFATTPEFEWLSEHAAEYGFILRFPQGAEAATQFKYAPYYWRYVGLEEAKAMKAAGQTLEQYLQNS